MILPKLSKCYNTGKLYQTLPVKYYCRYKKSLINPSHNNNIDEISVLLRYVDYDGATDHVHKNNLPCKNNPQLYRKRTKEEELESKWFSDEYLGGNSREIIL